LPVDLGGGRLSSRLRDGSNGSASGCGLLFVDMDGISTLMKDAAFIPVNFRLSQKARAKLAELTGIASKSSNRTMVPALFWHEEFDEKEKMVRGIGWGWYYRDEVPTRLLQDVDGITLLFGVSPEHVSCFSGKEIDYQEGKRFLFTP
jgi:hypothetical protein